MPSNDPEPFDICPRCNQDPCVCGHPHPLMCDARGEPFPVAPKFHPNDPKGHAGSLKAPIGEIPTAGLVEAAWVHQFGASRYGRFNWRDTTVLSSTYINALLRHTLAYRDGEDLDPESLRSHLGHIICNANILLDAAAHGTLNDDRYSKQIPPCAAPEQ